MLTLPHLPPLPAGLQQLLFNFGAVKNQVSGPVAIVAAGAEVKTTSVWEAFLLKLH